MELLLMFAGQMGCEALNFLLKRIIKEERPKRTYKFNLLSTVLCQVCVLTTVPTRRNVRQRLWDAVVARTVRLILRRLCRALHLISTCAYPFRRFPVILLGGSDHTGDCYRKWCRRSFHQSRLSQLPHSSTSFGGERGWCDVRARLVPRDTLSTVLGVD